MVQTWIHFKLAIYSYVVLTGLELPPLSLLHTVDSQCRDAVTPAPGRWNCPIGLTTQKLSCQGSEPLTALFHNLGGLTLAETSRTPRSVQNIS